MSDLIATLVNTLGIVLYISLIARVLMSWINVGPSSALYPLATIVYQITEPILAPIRRFTTFGMLDLSPMVAIILVSVIQQIVSGLVR